MPAGIRPGVRPGTQPGFQIPAPPKVRTPQPRVGAVQPWGMLPNCAPIARPQMELSVVSE